MNLVYSLVHANLAGIFLGILVRQDWVSNIWDNCRPTLDLDCSNNLAAFETSDNAGAATFGLNAQPAKAFFPTWRTSTIG